MMTEKQPVLITQSVAILIDGNNIERSLHSMSNSSNVMLNFDSIIPKLLNGRGLSRLIYFREGKAISSKLAQRLLSNYHGSVVPCHKSADIPLTINATQIAKKVDTIIILSGDSDYVELVRHLKGEGVRVEIAAIEETAAAILLDEADHFVPITKEDSFGLAPSKSTPRRNTRSNNSNNEYTSSPQKSKPKTKPSEKTPPRNTKQEKEVKPTRVQSKTNYQQNDAYFLKEEVKQKGQKNTNTSKVSTSRNNPKKTVTKAADKGSKSTARNTTPKSNNRRKPTATTPNNKTKKTTPAKPTANKKPSSKPTSAVRKRAPRKTK